MFEAAENTRREPSLGSKFRRSGRLRARPLGALAFFTLLGACSGPAGAADFTAANRFLREGAVAYGERNFDPATNLVRRKDAHYNRLDVCQHSLEYAAALFDSGRMIDRADAVVSAVLDHQDVDEKSATFGNFRWWHDETRVRDRNAVAFMSPWLSYITVEHADKLTETNRRRLPEALRRCVRAVRAHTSGPDYTNIWLLKAASLVMIARALGDRRLEEDGGSRLDRWIAYTANNGVSEYNSPCYSAVDIYALEWIHHYTTDGALRSKAARCLNYLYADVFQNWHWKAAIGAGTHSRAYPADRETGRSLVSCLVFKQCGRPLRQKVRSFLYVFAVNDYPVPDRVRKAAEKRGMYPFALRYRILTGAKSVYCSLFTTPQFTLGTQTGRRPVYNDRTIWDIPFKITYAGTKSERRASYVTPKPTTYHATVASLQEGPLAIVLYEVDLKGSKLTEGRMYLDIEPKEGGMCDEIVVAGRRYDRSREVLPPGTVLGWRVGETLVAIRLLRSRGVDRNGVGPAAYRLGPAPGRGLCLDCPLTGEPGRPVALNHLNCGFVVACTTVTEEKSLSAFLKRFSEWKVAERRGNGRVRIDWRAGGKRLELVWDEIKNRVVSRTVNGKPIDFSLRYRSPLIRLADGEAPAIVSNRPAAGTKKVAENENRTAVWLDTDIGGDIDDAACLLCAIRHPRIKLIGVSTVRGCIGSIRVAAWLARTLLDRAGRDKVPVLPGSRTALNGRGAYDDPGTYGDLAPPLKRLPATPEADNSRIDAIAKAMRATKEPFYVVAVGPLSNVARLALRHPDVARKWKGVVCMAGSLGREPECNVRLDVEGARVVAEKLILSLLGRDEARSAPPRGGEDQ